jgi:ubiquitin thioesterase protein OTUB1
VVVYLRLLSSSHVRLNPEEYSPFLDFPYTENITLFCTQCIEAFGRDADHIAILALARAIRVNIKISYLDGNECEEPMVHTANPDEWIEGDEVELLYFPGHYDILCRDQR